MRKGFCHLKGTYCKSDGKIDGCCWRRCKSIYNVIVILIMTLLLKLFLYLKLLGKSS
jgi:hypothetical protein